MTVGDGGGVAVVGSANLDIVVSLDRVPERGETVFGTAYNEYPGGKGANQAIAAARLGRTSLVASVGRDAAGRDLVEYLAARHVDTTWMLREAPATGRAFITVTPDGENAITVLSLANSELEPAEVIESLDRIRPRVVASQQEVSPAAVAAAVQWCVHNSARFVLNASPTGPLPAAAVELADPLIVNEVEARAILGLDASDGGDGASLARALGGRARSAVLTAGSRGAFVVRAGAVTPIGALAATPVDTTGAGDEFAGTLAGCLARGDDLLDAAAMANAAAARLIGIPRGDR
ncbi:MAG TPA: ribokinase [Galbitalea sp.]|jgi:ribokinase